MEKINKYMFIHKLILPMLVGCGVCATEVTYYRDLGLFDPMFPTEEVSYFYNLGLLDPMFATEVPYSREEKVDILKLLEPMLEKEHPSPDLEAYIKEYKEAKKKYDGLRLYGNHRN